MYEKDGKIFVSEEEYLNNIQEIEEETRKNKKRRIKIISVTGFVLCVLSYLFVKFLDFIFVFRQKLLWKINNVK